MRRNGFAPASCSAALALLANGMQVPHHLHAATPLPTFRQTLHNDGDMRYTAEIHVGGQKLRGMLDTGSFEVMVFSKDCNKCGKKAELYDDASSATFQPGEGKSIYEFGSGKVSSYQAFDTVEIGPFKSRNQTFWKVVDTDIPLADWNMQAIVGVGPPGSAIKMDSASQTASKEPKAPAHEKEAHVKSKKGAIIHGVTIGDEDLTYSEQVLATVPSGTDHGDAVSICDQFGVRTVSVCLGDAPGSSGYFVWNDPAPTADSQLFTPLTVAGDIHWVVRMTSVKLPLQSQSDTQEIACEDGCAAVLDSGTSWIAAPPDVFLRVQAIVDSLEEEDDECSGLSDLPDFEFKLDGHSFRLPADAIIGRSDTGRGCRPLIMSSNIDTQLGKMWILGMPFFRKYYTSFSYQSRGGHMRKSIFVALAHNSCRLDSSSNLIAHRRAPVLRQQDSKKVQAPWWLPKAQALKSIKV